MSRMARPCPRVPDAANIVASVATMLVVVLAGCGGDDGGGPPGGPLDDLRVTAPDGFAELGPGEAADVAWEVTASDAYGLELGVVGDDVAPRMIERRPLAAGTLRWNGVQLDGIRAPAGNYHVYASALGPDDGAVQTVDGGADHLIVVQGVRFRDATLSFTDADLPGALVLSTVARSPMELTLVLDPDVGTELDEKTLLTASIPGELVPVARSYPFTGLDASGAPIGGGTYTLAAVIRARGGAITYRVDGPTLTWTP